MIWLDIWAVSVLLLLFSLGFTFWLVKRVIGELDRNVKELERELEEFNDLRRDFKSLK